MPILSLKETLNRVVDSSKESASAVIDISGSLKCSSI